MTINERVSDERLNTISAEYSRPNHTKDFSVKDWEIAAIARELQKYRAAAEPVAYMHRSGQVVTREECCDDKTFAICCKVETPLYAAPQVTCVPDEHYRQLSDLYHAQEKWLFKLAQRIKGPSFDKYAYSPSHAIDVLEAAIFGNKEECGMAAAPAVQAEQLSGNTEQVSQPALPPDYLQGYKDGCEWSALMAEANHPQTGDWLFDDPIELAKAIRKGPDMLPVESGNSPAIPDGYALVPVKPTSAILDEFDSIIDYGAEDSKDAWCRLLASALVKSPPAAPKQEDE